MLCISLSELVFCAFSTIPICPFFNNSKNFSFTCRDCYGILYSPHTLRSSFLTFTFKSFSLWIKEANLTRKKKKTHSRKKDKSLSSVPNPSGTHDCRCIPTLHCNCKPLQKKLVRGGLISDSCYICVVLVHVEID